MDEGAGATEQVTPLQTTLQQREASTGGRLLGRLLKQEKVGGREIAPLAGTQIVRQPQAIDRRAGQRRDAEAGLLAHVADLPVATFLEDEA